MSDPKPQKTGQEKLTMPALLAIITALSSTGIAGVFGLFDDDDDRKAVARNGSSTTEIHQFITKSTREKVVDLEGDWLFTTGDDPSWATSEFDDSEWSSINVPDRWESEGFRGYDGFAWYRKSFDIAAEVDDSALFLFLGRIDDVDETYVNGEKIGGQGHFEPALTGWDRNRIYRIPEGLLTVTGENVIAVRVFDGEQGGGIYTGKVGIFRSLLPQPLLDLSGDWAFSTGDNANWKLAKADESEFSTIQVPMAWEAEGFEGYDGFAWYRKRFERFDVSSAETLVLMLGRIDDTDEVFLNGELIGKTGELDGHDRERNPDFYRFQRIYTFPASLLKDENILAVRVHDSSGLGGLYSGPLGIMSKERFDESNRVLEEADRVTFADAVDWLLGRN